MGLLTWQWGGSYCLVAFVTTWINFSFRGKSKFLISLLNSRSCAFKEAFCRKMTRFGDTTVVPLQSPPTSNNIQLTRLPPCRSPPSSAVSDRHAVLTPSWGTAKVFMDLIARQAVIRLFSWLHTPQTGRKRNKKEGGNGEQSPLNTSKEMLCAGGREELFHGQELCYECIHFMVGRGRNKPVSWK